MVRQSADPAPLDVTSFGSRCASFCLRCCAKLHRCIFSPTMDTVNFLPIDCHCFWVLEHQHLPESLYLPWAWPGSQGWNHNCPGLRFPHRCRSCIFSGINNYEHWMLDAAALYGIRKCPFLDKNGTYATTVTDSKSISKAVRSHHPLSEHGNHWISNVFDSEDDSDGIQTCSKKISNRHETPQHLSASDLNSWNPQNYAC